MSNLTTSVFATLEATASTSQCRNPFFQREQLKSVHDILRVNAKKIILAIENDTGVPDIETTAEFAHALSVVKEHYESIDSTKELENEYKPACGKGREDRRVPVGVVYVDPDLSHTPFFSVMVSLSAALAAGNCVLLKLENSLRALPSLLRTLLPQALNADVFAIVSSDPQQELLERCVQVLQSVPIDRPTQAYLTSSHSRAISIVDRTADLASAAEHLVTARFAFEGTSPYAPDIVLVNEFVRKEFLELVLRKSIRFLTASTTKTNSEGKVAQTRRNESRRERLDQSLQDINANQNWKVNIITKGDSGAIVEFSSRSNKHVALPPKSRLPLFIVSAITSLDHAVDLISESTSPAPLLAAYHFAAPSHAKYLAQFISSEVTFINHIPPRLLLGPAAPSFRKFDLENRYTKAHFTFPAPIFVSSPDNQKQAALLSHDNSRTAVDALMRNATREITEGNRPEWIARGFFEQGIFIGLGVYGVPLVACIGAGLFYAVRTGIRYFPSFN